MTTQSATHIQQMKEAELIPHSREEVIAQCSQMIDLIARRAFEIFESRGGSPGHDLEDWFRAESELLHPIPLNVTESNEEFVIRAEVPGFVRKDIEIGVEARSLAISGERETKRGEEYEKSILSEWSVDRIFRSLVLLADVDTSKVITTGKDGILTVDLPKTQIAK